MKPPFLIQMLYASSVFEVKPLTEMVKRVKIHYGYDENDIECENDDSIINACNLVVDTAMKFGIDLKTVTDNFTKRTSKEISDEIEKLIDSIDDIPDKDQSLRLKQLSIELDAVSKAEFSALPKSEQERIIKIANRFEKKVSSSFD